MSREQPGWVERNVDVLVQLLQSGESSCSEANGTFPSVSGAPLSSPDEPAEVVVVKTAFIQHLELDSKVAPGVLYDRTVPDDPMGDEYPGRSLPGLRMLVVAFLAEDARGSPYSRDCGAETGGSYTRYLTLS